MSGIELFLTAKIYGHDQHPLGWDKYVYDDENIHYAVLKLLSESCPAFAHAILQLPTLPSVTTVLFQPERGLFDLLFRTDGIQTYCEIKVWANLSEDQLLRQTLFLKEHTARGVYVLFTKAADTWSPSEISSKSEGRANSVRCTQLLEALDTLGHDQPLALLDLACAYRKALMHLTSRWPMSSVQSRP